jgi:serine/threonine protein kinase
MALPAGTNLGPYEIDAVIGAGGMGEVYRAKDTRLDCTVSRLDLATGKRQLVMTLAVSDPSGVTAISAVRMTPDGKSYAYSYYRELSDLFLVEGVR